MTLARRMIDIIRQYGGTRKAAVSEGDSILSQKY